MRRSSSVFLRSFHIFDQEVSTISSSYLSTTREWPELHYEQWGATASALHLWMQIVGKVRLVQTPWTNHSWHVPLYLSGRGLTTSPIPHSSGVFEMTFDLIDHELVIQRVSGQRRVVPLRSQSVAEFHAGVVAELKELGIDLEIYTTPSEIADAMPFEKDTVQRAYDPESATRFWRVLIQIDQVFKAFRAKFIGKCSPVHFFWGSFDLAVSRFSGREAPPHPGGVPNLPDWVAREAYSHEVSSAGFWPGDDNHDALFYSYAYPAPEGFSKAAVSPAEARWDASLGEFVLPYESVRTSSRPDDSLLEFLQSTYEAAAEQTAWDRAALERELPPVS